MPSKEDNRKATLDHMVDEKFAEIFFLAREEYDIEKNSNEEQKLYTLIMKFKEKLKSKCKHHFETEE